MGISREKQKNASLDDDSSIVIAWNDGFPACGDGSSIYGEISVSSAPFQIVYKTLMKPDDIAHSAMRERSK
jgi:hypothetical protein